MALQKEINAVVFDLGGVLLNLDYSLSTRAFQKFSDAFDSFDPVYSGHSNKELFEDFETGSISAAVFRAEICKVLKRDLSDAELDKAWNAMLLDFPGHRVDLLKRLGKEKRIFL